MKEVLTMQNDLRQLLIGSLLGDGCFCSVSKITKNKCLSIAHSMKQYEYLKYKWNILNRYNLVPPIKEREITNSRYLHPTKECRLKTRLHPIFTQIRDTCYDNTGHKRVNIDFIKDIDSLGLAIWYMDDGYVTKNSCILSTCSFTLEEQISLAKLLLEKFQLHFNVGKHDNSMYLQAADFPKFRCLIVNYVIPSMQYKLVPYSKRVLYKSGELLEHPNGTISSQALQGCKEGSETNSIPLEQ